MFNFSMIRIFSILIISSQLIFAMQEEGRPHSVQYHVRYGGNARFIMNSLPAVWQSPDLLMADGEDTLVVMIAPFIQAIQQGVKQHKISSDDYVQFSALFRRIFFSSTPITQEVAASLLQQGVHLVAHKKLAGKVITISLIEQFWTKIFKLITSVLSHRIASDELVVDWEHYEKGLQRVVSIIEGNYNVLDKLRAVQKFCYRNLIIVEALLQDREQDLGLIIMSPIMG